MVISPCKRAQVIRINKKEDNPPKREGKCLENKGKEKLPDSKTHLRNSCSDGEVPNSKVVLSELQYEQPI